MGLTPCWNYRSLQNNSSWSIMAKLPPNFPLPYNFCQVVINFNVARFVLRCCPAVLIRTAMLTGCRVIACVADLLEYVYMYVRAPCVWSTGCQDHPGSRPPMVSPRVCPGPPSIHNLHF